MALILLDVDRYEWESGIFHGRQHILNHIDLLLGLSQEEYGNNRDKRAAVNVISRYGDMRISRMRQRDDDTIAQGRKWVQYQSLFASSWELLYPMVGDSYFAPTDIKDDDELLALLNECLTIWIEEDAFCGGDYERFRNETSFIVLLGSWDPVRADRIIVRQRPTPDFDDLPVPINNKRNMAKQHESRIEWRAFADKICQNEYVKKSLTSKQDGKCAICGKALGRTVVIHHVDYDHECGLAQLSDCWTRPGTQVQPDCERCQSRHVGLFNECLERIRAVHSDCNYLIEATL